MRLPFDLLLTLPVTPWTSLGSWLPSLSAAAEPSPLLSYAATSYLNSSLNRWGVPGSAIAVVVGPAYTGDGTWRTEYHTFGVADGKGHPVANDTLFAIASNSKLFTALALGLLIENDTALSDGSKLDWNTKVTAVLPDFAFASADATQHADFTDLLSMRSGMPSHDLAQLPPKRDTLKDLVHNMRHLPMSAEIRQTFQYNNKHYFTVALAIETLTGVPFHDFVKEHILDPVGLVSATYNHEDAAASGRRSDCFAHVGINKTACAARSDPPNRMDASCRGERRSFGWWTEGDALVNAGAGGIVTDIRDVATWLRELLAPEHISKRLIDECARPRSISDWGGMPLTSRPGYGFGQASYAYRGEDAVMHTGGLPGQTSQILRLPGRDIGVAVLTNSMFAGPRFFQIATNRILDELLKVDPYDFESVAFDKVFRQPAGGWVPDKRSPPEGGFKRVPGTYANRGYGKLEFKPVDVEHDESQRTIAAALALAGVDMAGLPAFIAPFSRTFASYFVMIHHSGSLFNTTTMLVYDDVEKGHGKVTEVLAPLGVAVVTKEGMGLFGGFTGSNPEDVKQYEPQVEGVKEKCEVWFDRE